MLKSFPFSAALLLFTLGCTSTQMPPAKQEAKQGSQTHPGTETPKATFAGRTVVSPEDGTTWYQGSLENALAEAKKTDRPLLMYWGAEWCPPCHALKARVFEHPKFNALTQNAILLYLDADKPEVRKYMNQYDVKAYPTLIFFNKDKEILRFNNNVSFDEFQDAYQVTAASIVPIEKRIARTLEDNAQKDDWAVFAFTRWWDTKLPEKHEKDKVALLLQLLEKAPDTEKRASRTLTLELASRVAADKNASEKNKDKIKALLKAELEHIQSSKATSPQTLDSLANGLEAYLGFLYKKGSQPKMLGKLDNYARSLFSDSDSSTETKLNATWILIETAKFRGQKPQKSQEITGNLAQLEKELEQQKSLHGFSAQLTALSYAFYSIGAKQKAKTLLTDNLKNVKTPWYLYNYLAYYAGKEKQYRKQIDSYRKGIAVAKPKSVKIRLLDRILGVQFKHIKDEKEIVATLENFYETVFQYKAGFLGEHKSLAKAIAKYDSKKTIEEVLKKRQQQCSKLNFGAKKCSTHFALALTEPEDAEQQ